MHKKIARAGAASRAATRLACLYWRLFLRERAEVPSNRAAERIDVIAALQNADDGHRAAAANRRHHRRRDLPVDWHVVHGSRRYGRSDYAALHPRKIVVVAREARERVLRVRVEARADEDL